MYRKDYVLNETQRLAQIIARLLGLKNVAGSEDELQQVYQNALNNEYGIAVSQLAAFTTNEFEHWLRQSNFTPVKLDALAQLLYHMAEPFAHDTETLARVKNILIVFDMLEREHHMQSFENIGKLKIIHQYIEQYHA